MSEPSIQPIIIYGTLWCPDCVRVKTYLKQRGVAFEEINIEHDPHGEDLVVRVNNGKRKVPTLKIGDHYLACSPFRTQKVADELGIPLNK